MISARLGGGLLVAALSVGCGPSADPDDAPDSASSGLTSGQCADQCMAQGNNAFNLSEEDPPQCTCAYAPAANCDIGATTCLGNGDWVAECLAGEEVGASANVFEAWPCEDVCAAAGFGPSQGCSWDAPNAEAVCWCAPASSHGCDASCPEGTVCLDGACYVIDDPPDGDEPQCYTDNDCAYLEICNGGACEQAECFSASDCGWCSRCQNRWCYDCGIAADGSCMC